MDSQQKGDQTESRAFDALKRIQHLHPTMVRKVRRTSPALDARGVDFLIEVNFNERGYRGWMNVPIEVKSSLFGVKKWKLKHRDHHKAGVLIFSIPSSLGQDEICWQIISALQQLRFNTKRGKLYVPWWGKIFKGKMSPRGQQNAKNIARRRAEKKNRGRR